jgi:hypothetical protein
LNKWDVEGTHGKQSKERPYFKGSEWDKRQKTRVKGDSEDTVRRGEVQKTEMLRRGKIAQMGVGGPIEGSVCWA